MEKLTRGEIAKEILKGIAITAGMTAFVVLALAAPKMTAIVSKAFVDWYQAQSKSRRQQIRKTFKQLRRQRLVEEREINGKINIVLSEAGHRRVLEYKLDDIKIQPMKKWDGTWRIIIFDIPETMKKAREALRSKLKFWGCYPLQKSIFVTPNKCRDEIDFVTEVFQVSPHVRLIEAKIFDGVEDIKNHFNV